jgi:DNA modification methylase
MVQPIVIDQNNTILIGHCRFRALKRLKWEEVPCVRSENLSENEINKLRLLDNKLNEPEWDFDLLFDQIQELNWDDFDIDWGLDDFLKEDEKHEIIEDEVPDVEDTSISQVGDIYILGKHRLICGDSTDATVIDRLMDGVKADIAFTSPPYNAGTTATETAMGKTTKYNGNDDNRTESEYRDFLNSYLHCALSASEYVFMNVQSIANNKIALIDVLSDNKEIYADTIIWDKQNGQPAMANNVLNSVFEYIHIFSEKANRAIGTIDFRGTIDNIVHLPPQRNNEFSNIHNATFSVEFASWFISRFAKETVLDSFGGTGTTLIACEQLNRRCFMCELSPNYVDVIVKRYIDFTNNKNDVYVIRDGKKIKYKDLKA